MDIAFKNERPIYMQIAEIIENGILSGAYPEQSQVPSTTEISINFKVNPATALKGLNILVDSEIIYKKRGLGMFVSTGAISTIKQKRQQVFYSEFIVKLIAEAKSLGMNKQDILSMIERGFDREQCEHE